ncbi:velvet factor-domain-containing protein [Fennellomyces sp. T-0311]|nr:velvet factor-domain-containing protein [Fennellomyces sp. T-0311]
MNPIVPPPLGLGRPSKQSIQYRLVVVQNPTRARCCGFGEKDKRPINPPPILQLYIARPDGAMQWCSETDNVSHLIVQCDLFSADRKQNRNVLNDLDDRLGIFFIFSDLSVRTEGAFCLRFRFIDLSAGDPLTMSTEILHEVYSDPFQVYSAKNFPGMTGTTPLSQCFSRQGIKISVRKGPRTKRTSEGVFSAQADDDDDDDNNAMPQQQQQPHTHHRKSITAIAAFVSSGTPKASGNEGDSGGASSSRTELKETTTQLRSREATVATASSSTATTAPATPYTKIHISSVLASDDEDNPPWRAQRR